MITGGRVGVDRADVQIEAGKPTPVREGDRIEFGGRWLGIGR